MYMLSVSLLIYFASLSFLGVGGRVVSLLDGWVFKSSKEAVYFKIKIKPDEER